MVTLDMVLERASKLDIPMAYIQFDPNGQEEPPQPPYICWLSHERQRGRDDKNCIQEISASIELYTDQTVDQTLEKQIEEMVLYDVEFDKYQTAIEEEEMIQTAYEFEIVQKKERSKDMEGTKSMAESSRIILGSGYIHIGEYDNDKELPNPQDFCTEQNLYSYISGGATLEYKPSYYEAKDDMGRVSKTKITEEEATLKSGLMTFCGTTIGTLCETARVTEKELDGKKYRNVKVGGVGNANGKRYIICFHHEDPTDGDIWVMIVGNNQAGFSLAFTKDKETVVDAEFKAMPQDKEGTLIIYVEEVKGINEEAGDSGAETQIEDETV